MGSNLGAASEAVDTVGDSFGVAGMVCRVAYNVMLVGTIAAIPGIASPYERATGLSSPPTASRSPQKPSQSASGASHRA